MDNFKKSMSVCVVNLMITTLNGNIFRVTGIFVRWIPLERACDAELWCFPWSAPEQTVEQTIEAPVIWDAIPSLWLRCNILTSVALCARNLLITDGFHERDSTAYCGSCYDVTVFSYLSVVTSSYLIDVPFMVVNDYVLLPKRLIHGIYFMA